MLILLFLFLLKKIYFNEINYELKGYNENNSHNSKIENLKKCFFYEN